MTQEEKINLLKKTITTLYAKEGRSKTYISNLLDIDRKMLSIAIDKWELIKADERRLTPSNEKFLNKNKKLILDGMNSNRSLSEIADQLNIPLDKLVRTFIRNNPELFHTYNEYKTRERNLQQHQKEMNILKAIDNSSFDYMTESDNLIGEVWKDILGYDGYQVSNMGRIRNYAKRYGMYYLLKLQRNVKNGRVYVCLSNENGRRNLNLARIVAHAFVDGYSDEKNTVDHRDGDVTNNKAENLEWVTQKINNERAYMNGKKGHCAYSKNKKFQCIMVDDKYQFKTIRALGKFLGVSESQAHRYLSGESKSNHTFKFIY